MLYHFLDLCVVNSFILWRGDTNLPLYQYKLDVATSLMFCENFSEPLSRAAILLRHQGQQEAAKRDPLGEANPVAAVQIDQQNHWPNSVAKVARRCKVPRCPGRSVIWCTKCHVYLCLKNDSNCFLMYHTV